LKQSEWFATSLLTTPSAKSLIFVSKEKKTNVTLISGSNRRSIDKLKRTFVFFIRKSDQVNAQGDIISPDVPQNDEIVFHQQCSYNFLLILLLDESYRFGFR
jgi:hypothetical protein